MTIKKGKSTTTVVILPSSWKLIHSTGLIKSSISKKTVGQMLKHTRNVHPNELLAHPDTKTVQFKNPESRSALTVVARMVAHPVCHPLNLYAEVCPLKIGTIVSIVKEKLKLFEGGTMYSNKVLSTRARHRLHA